MNALAHIAMAISDLIHPYLTQVALALVATLLFIYGENIHALVKRPIAKQHFLVRVSILIVVCAFGYGALSVLLASLDRVSLAPVVCFCFVIVGILAERKRQI